MKLVGQVLCACLLLSGFVILGIDGVARGMSWSLCLRDGALFTSATLAASLAREATTRRQRKPESMIHAGDVG
jgi:hypothetical protein